MTEDRTRADRIDEEWAARQARLEGSIDGAKNLKLAIPSDVQQRLDEEGRVGRWVVDDPTRIRQLTDPTHAYRPVDGVEPISTRNGKGEPIQMKLMSKRKDFIADDKARREARRRDIEQAQLSAADAGPGFYADKANKFSRGGSG